MIVIWIFVFLFISELGFWLPLSAVILTVALAYLNARVVKKQTEQLATGRKIRLDEMRRFYTSPEWLVIRKEVIREEGNVCSECKQRIASQEDVTVDHIKPRSKYPDLALDRKNLRVLCRSCNSRKGDSDSEIFAAEIE